MTRSRPVLAALCLAVGAALLPLAPVPARADGGESVPALIAEASADYRVDYWLMVRIAKCESGMNRLAVNRYSGAAGVYQWVAATWRWASYAAGYGGASRFDATANVRVAAWLLAQPGGARHWRSCL